jgi:folate-binding protein YgfZ
MTTNSSNLPTLKQLPPAYVIDIDNFSAISLKGEEQSKYLQGQVTCDVNTIDEVKLLNGGHCNAKGKLLSVFRLFNYQGRHLLFQPYSSLTASLSALKKFGVFAKVDIEEETHLQFTAIAGEQAHDAILQCFGQVPDNLTPVIEQDSALIVYIAGNIERYLLVAPIQLTRQYLTTLALPKLSSEVWQLLEINEGFPLLSETLVEHYVPQMLNLQAIHGISFTKGCYLGQETVARMQYLGKNKRALFLLNGSASNNISTGDIIEIQLGENWRKAGDVMSNYQSSNGDVTIQAVLNSDIDNSAVLRLKGEEESLLTITALPYSLD